MTASDSFDDWEVSSDQSARKCDLSLSPRLLKHLDSGFESSIEIVCRNCFELISQNQADHHSAACAVSTKDFESTFVYQQSTVVTDLNHQIFKLISTCLIRLNSVSLIQILASPK